MAAIVAPAVAGLAVFPSASLMDTARFLDDEGVVPVPPPPTPLQLPQLPLTSRAYSFVKSTISWAFLGRSLPWAELGTDVGPGGRGPLRGAGESARPDATPNDGGGPGRTRSGISSGASCGRGGRGRLAGGVPVPMVLPSFRNELAVIDDAV